MNPDKPKTKIEIPIEIPKEYIPKITWTPQEDQILIHGVEKLKYSYSRISHDLIPNYFPWQCEKRYIQLKRKQKITLTIQQIQEMDFLLEGQKEMAISLFHAKPLYAHNYIENIIENQKK
jgi:hypothetical protein